jgi:hypothetical protein
MAKKSSEKVQLVGYVKPRYGAPGEIVPYARLTFDSREEARKEGVSKVQSRKWCKFEVNPFEVSPILFKGKKVQLIGYVKPWYGVRGEIGAYSWSAFDTPEEAREKGVSKVQSHHWCKFEVKPIV